MAAVLLLAVNDWILKAAYPSWWTGKLSDFAGLYAFSLFWCAFLPRRRAIILALTGVGFLIWKSPLSSSPIAVWNALGLWPVGRVVDYTDWIALVALVAAARSSHTCPRPVLRHWAAVGRRAAAVTMAVLAAMAFMATDALPTNLHEFPADSGYQVDGARAVVRAYFLAHEWGSNRDDLGATIDTMSSVPSGLIGFPGGLLITLRDASPCGTHITLVALESAEPGGSEAAKFELMTAQEKFEQEVIPTLRLHFPACSPAVTERLKGSRRP